MACPALLPAFTTIKFPCFLEPLLLLLLLRLLCLLLPSVLTNLIEGDVPLELEGELLPLARGLVLGTDQDVIEKEEVPQLPGPFSQLNSEGVLHQVPLRPLLVRVQLPPEIMEPSYFRAPRMAVVCLIFRLHL